MERRQYTGFRRLSHGHRHQVFGQHSEGVCNLSQHRPFLPGQRCPFRLRNHVQLCRGRVDRACSNRPLQPTGTAARSKTSIRRQSRWLRFEREDPSALPWNPHLPERSTPRWLPTDRHTAETDSFEFQRWLEKDIGQTNAQCLYRVATWCICTILHAPAQP